LDFFPHFGGVLTVKTGFKIFAFGAGTEKKNGFGGFECFFWWGLGFFFFFCQEEKKKKSQLRLIFWLIFVFFFREIVFIFGCLACFFGWFLWVFRVFFADNDWIMGIFIDFYRFLE
jgi:hypothetical protein